MIYKRHYVQYNDLVFEGYQMIEEDDTEVSFKNNMSDYGFRHGSYAPFKRMGVLAEAGGVSMTLTFELKRIPCDQRPFYLQFVISQLSKQGKLWAVRNNTLLWAYAFVSSYNEHTDARKNTFVIDVEFTIPEGVWHKADKQKTFLVPHDICDFLDCENFKDINPCAVSNIGTGDCCDCLPNKTVKKDDCSCCCDELTKDMALCYHDLQDFYARCNTPYKIVYDCRAAKNLWFPDYYSPTHMGQKFCANCAPIAGILYSDTDIPTEGVKITLHGRMSNPYIEINGNGNSISGDYDGTLEIYPNGEIYFGEDDCARCEPLDVTKWVIPSGMSYGWSVQTGNNRLIIDAGCCGTVCAYIEVDALTI